jgi:xylulokinase
LAAKRIKAIGGGSKSALFCGIKADCLNIPYAILPEREFSTLGSALVAAAAVGDIRDLPGTVLNINAKYETLTPDRVRAEQYDACFRDYEQTIDGLITIFNQRNSS